TPDLKTIDEITSAFKLKPTQLVKTIIYMADGDPIVCLVRGDCDISEAKLRKAMKAQSVTLADEKTIEEVTGAPVGFAGPVGLTKKCSIVADHSVRGVNNFVTGANKKDTHMKNVNRGRDFECTMFADIRYVKDGEQCPACAKGSIKLERALEIGHVFKLGTKYTKALKGKFTDQDSKDKDIIMGCYGIGVNRIMAACIELHHDEKGIKWPLAIAPFKVLLLTVNQTQEKSVAYTEKLYDELCSRGVDVLWDDRDVRAGVKFNDADLIGIPMVIVVGDRNLKDEKVEIKTRHDGQSKLIPAHDVEKELKILLSK
ncbi:MAG: proline--tRNA ligase, partial [Candidatus Omnitrophica bacterium]|nr:proline--tRNA ligase [Candidatus Omnitrophota bacterium]